MNSKKRALGRGLSALLDSTGIEAQPVYNVEKDLLPVGTIGNVPLDIIETNPYQPREDFNEESLMELAASIREQGVIQPVTVRKTDKNKLQLIAGERRCKAARLAGLETIPAYIVSATDHSMLEMAIVENIQRDNLNPIEIALGYKQLLQEYSFTQEMLSEKIGKSRSSIANYIRLLNLPGEIQIALRQETITQGHARALLALDDTNLQLEVYQDILTDSLSVRDVEEIVKNISFAREHPVEEKQTPGQGVMVTPGFVQIEKDLSYLFDCKVQLKTRKSGKGNIVMHFSSEEELNKIISMLKK